MNISKVEIDPSRFSKEPSSDNLPIIPTRNLVLFPGITVSFELSRPMSLAVAEAANKNEEPVGIVSQMFPDEDNPTLSKGMASYGVYADVLNIFQPDADSAPVALVRARERFKIEGRGVGDNQIPGCLYAAVKPLPPTGEPKNKKYFGTIVDMICDEITESLKISGDPNHIIQAVQNITDKTEIVNFLCTNIPEETKAKIAMLAIDSIEGRALELYGHVSVFKERVELTRSIAEEARRSMDENQRNAFLQQQMEHIREALYGDESDDVDNLISRAEAAGMPDEVFTTFKKEAAKMRRYNPSSPDYSVQYSYLDTLASLPWSKSTKEKVTLQSATKVLENDHYGLKRVKERIIEQIALHIAGCGDRSPIICLVGAPGVGKTSIGKSIARAMGRKYGRVSFGGLHDEAEIRGHRRTYIGAMPGRIIDAIKRVGVNNPVLVLDEIDKIGADYKGDPGAALLEVLDPEQNCHFHDNYVDVDFDLSKVLFIATANTLSTISKPLLDRMEIIDIDGYLQEEKIEIARRHLLPRALQNHGLTKRELKISDETLAEIISRYTAESGVRQLEKKLGAIARKRVVSKLKNEKFPSPVKPADLYNLLGLAPYLKESYEGNDIAGVVTGLAWTQVGGEILMAETSLSPAKEGRLSVTGNLGDVMKESASIAYQWIKSNARAAGVDREELEKLNVHVHFPEGAVPKDGPSAGITIVTSMVSALRGTKVAPRLAMTGEISLRGKVLPVGGIREKILAAKRAGITDLVMSERNRRDIDDMPQDYRQGLTFHFVDTINQVLDIAITDEPAPYRYVKE